MKKFNQMTEKQMQHTNGGAIIFFVIFLMSLTACASAGALAGSVAGITSKNK